MKRKFCLGEKRVPTTRIYVTYAKRGSSVFRDKVGRIIEMIREKGYEVLDNEGDIHKSHLLVAFDEHPTSVLGYKVCYAQCVAKIPVIVVTHPAFASELAEYKSPMLHILSRDNWFKEFIPEFEKIVRSRNLD